ncbi:hypothetical protein F4779DRAFT_643116 [Xylariaceae sp. FL0662B]|nr:hypothetical protein F4779DRAFT_643116 [Xylariaceae sp. FL0662B]
MRSTTMLMFLSGALSLGIASAATVPEGTAGQKRHVINARGEYLVKDTPNGGVWSNMPPEAHEKARRDFEEEEAREKRAIEEEQENKKRHVINARGEYLIKDTPNGGVWSNIAPEVHEKARRDFEEEEAREKRAIEEQAANKKRHVINARGEYLVKDTPNGGVWSNIPPEAHEKARRDFEEEEAREKRAIEEEEQQQANEKRYVINARGEYLVKDTPNGGVWSNIPPEAHENARREFEESEEQ